MLWRRSVYRHAALAKTLCWHRSGLDSSGCASPWPASGTMPCRRHCPAVLLRELGRWLLAPSRRAADLLRSQCPGVAGNAFSGTSGSQPSKSPLLCLRFSALLPGQVDCAAPGPGLAGAARSGQPPPGRPPPGSTSGRWDGSACLPPCRAPGEGAPGARERGWRGRERLLPDCLRAAGSCPLQPGCPAHPVQPLLHRRWAAHFPGDAQPEPGL